MNNPLIKICGVRTPELAYAAGIAGANFIGVVFHPQSRRYVNLNMARLIAHAAKDAGAIPVAVFVEHTALEMQMICDTTGIEVVQLHGCVSRQQQHKLPVSYQRIYVDDIDSQCPSCEVGDPERDYLLFDNPDPGKGIPFDWDQFHYAGPYRLGLAGGLTSKNVAIAIKKFHPALVDVSSGVENLSGEKDIALIKQFIGVCHGTN